MVINPSTKNFNLIPGMLGTLKFDLVDDTFLPVDGSSYLYKLEVLNPNGTLRFTATTGFQGTSGSVCKSLLETDTLSIGSGIYRYRLVAKSLDQSFNALVYSGFLASNEPKYEESLTVAGNSISLPDGSLYVTVPTVLQYGTWYAVSSFYRLVVTGIGSITLDTRSNTGEIFNHSGDFTTWVDSSVTWFPDLSLASSFRLTQQSGSNQVTYLP